jgi:hypothetical protein
MKYTIYDSSTGEIQMTFSSHDAELTQQNLQGRAWIPGNYSSVDCYVENGEVRAKPPQPDAPGQVFDFDYSTRTWQINTSRSEQSSRQLRNLELQLIDKINPVWYNSLTNEQQQELAQYRQALLDVPQQSGFPITVNWPAKPTWL